MKLTSLCAILFLIEKRKDSFTYESYYCSRNKFTNKKCVGMLQFRWLRLFIRRNTSPIHVDRALQWKKRLSVLYAVLAWHAFGGVLYMCYTGKRDWMRAEGYVPDVDVLPARSWAHTLGIPQAQVIQMSGFKIKGSYEIKEGEDLYIGTAAERTVGNEEAVSSRNDST
ncbi:uncharacterized protein LOC124180888 [Neodiprion fabricii]|uniref:uncharacterized protein LOC124180888 n=1 Tax=Neodiprion fabricii TaxID=2872261 RepID=UPI001ED945D3|nr:uncharacterized protein LOC124180888 [Neodiprion fabricii]